ncbi:MAG: hypothetical protein ACRDI2_03690 [Chloroflexota bacterium]
MLTTSDVLWLQRTIGNASVGSLLVQRKVKHTTGKEVDTFLSASPFIKKYVADKIRKGIKAEGHVHIHAAADFEKAWEKYATKRTNPDTGATFTVAEARAWEPTVNAFRDGSEIHIHEDRGEAGTAIHEAMHLFSADSYRAKLGADANEGTTEYFTRMICDESKIVRGAFYVDERRSIERLIAATSKDKVAAAYYQGATAELEAAVDAKKKGTFAKWVLYLKMRKYADADALL